MNTKVLIVDDDIGIQETLVAILEWEGYQISCAQDGLEALTLVEKETPDVILLDLMMPRMDGYAFVAELKRRGLRQRFPILLLTADARAREKALRLEAEAYLAKPFDMDTLLETVAMLANAA